MRSYKLFLGILSISFSATVLAIDYPYLMRSPTALLMGDAFTAVNDDEYTLFYNPASLGRHKNDLTVYPFSGHLAGTNILGDMDRFKDFPEEPVGAADVLMNYPAHASAGLAPGFKLFNVGVSFIFNESYDALLRNKTHPMLDLDIRSDRGVAFGVGIPIGPHRIGRKSNSGMQTSLGVSAKFLKRKGIRDTLSLTGPTVSDSLGQEELDDVLKTLGQAEGQAWGFDAGVEHVIRKGSSQVIMGISALDITTTDFEETKNPNNLEVSDIEDQVNFGIAAGQQLPLFHYILSADVRGLNEQMDFGKRLRVGGQIGIPGITLMGGLNSGYYSYGATLDLAFLRLTAGLYDVELGSKYRQTKSKRFIIYLSLFDFSFDS